MARTGLTRVTRLSAAVAVAGALLAASCTKSDDTGSGTTTTSAKVTSTTTAATAGGIGRGSDEWTTATPADVGMDGAELDKIAAEAKGRDTTCLLVARHGKIVGEWYFNGGAEHEDQEVFSATKSFTSVLVGIAQDEGHLKVTDRADAWIPSWTGTPSAVVTVKDLLSNDSGRFWSFTSDYGDLIRADDKDAYAAGLDQAAAPGQVWAYNNAAIQNLSAIVDRATDTPFSRYGKEKLLAPLGMKDSAFADDASGHGVAFMGLHSTCRDLGRFGEMILREGRWNGTQVVSAAYLRAATAQPSQPLNAAYGYLFWLNRKGAIASAVSPLTAEQVAGAKKSQLVPGAPDDLVWALGLGGQVVQVHAATDTVVVRLGSGGIGATYGPAETARVVTQAVQD